MSNDNKCIWNHPDCRMNHHSTCTGLTDCRFNRLDCPFYKTEEQFQKELREIKRNAKRNAF